MLIHVLVFRIAIENRVSKRHRNVGTPTRYDKPKDQNMNFHCQVDLNIFVISKVYCRHGADVDR